MWKLQYPKNKKHSISDQCRTWLAPPAQVDAAATTSDSSDSSDSSRRARGHSPGTPPAARRTWDLTRRHDDCQCRKMHVEFELVDSKKIISWTITILERSWKILKGWKDEIAWVDCRKGNAWTCWMKHAESYILPSTQWFVPQGLPCKPSSIASL